MKVINRTDIQQRGARIVPNQEFYFESAQNCTMHILRPKSRLKVTRRLSIARNSGGHPHRFTGFVPHTSAPSGARFRTSHFRTAHRNCRSAPLIPHFRAR